MTSFPVDSRTTVLGETQVGLTSGFGMRPGKHHRYDRAPIFFESDMDATSVAVNWHKFVDEEHSRCGYIRKKDARTLVLLD